MLNVGKQSLLKCLNTNAMPMLQKSPPESWYIQISLTVTLSLSHPTVTVTATAERESGMHYAGTAAILLAFSGGGAGNASCPLAASSGACR